MDLRAAADQNAKVDKLARAGMIGCFLVTVLVLIGTLAMAKSADQQQTLQPAQASSLR